MSDNLMPPEKEPEVKDAILQMFEDEERGYFRRLSDMCKGLGQPRDSIEFKKAWIEFQRLGAPIAAVLIIVSALLVMSLIKPNIKEAPPAIQTEIIEPEPAEELTEEPEPPPEEPPELDETPLDVDVTIDIDAPPSPSVEQSPQPSPMDSVAITQSPVVMRGVMGSRNPGTRGGAIGRYGGGDVEKYLYGNLRYLVTKQRPDGLWGNGQGGSLNSTIGETAMALLTFLAHGETPSSPEFGKCVEKAIRALLARQEPNGLFRGRDAHNYAHLVAVYALSEAYAMTRIPEIKDAVAKALPHIYNGQTPAGSWFYNFETAKGAKSSTSDLSITGWAIQALKAAKIAGFHDPKIIAALKKSIRGLEAVKCPNGAFGYRNTSHNSQGLTAVALLALQMLDSADTPMARKAFDHTEYWEPTFMTNQAFPTRTKQKSVMQGGSPQYYCYYLAQVRFNMGPNHPAWKRWNATMSKLYRAAYIMIPAEKSGYKDHNGRPQYIGFWGTTKGRSKYKGDNKELTDVERLKYDRATRNGMRNGIPIDQLIIRDAEYVNTADPANNRVLSNCAVALQMMVYFRNSPLAKGALTKIEAEAEVKVDEGANEVEVEGIDDL